MVKLRHSLPNNPRHNPRRVTDGHVCDQCLNVTSIQNAVFVFLISLSDLAALLFFFFFFRIATLRLCNEGRCNLRIRIDGEALISPEQLTHFMTCRIIYNHQELL